MEEAEKDFAAAQKEMMKEVEPQKQICSKNVDSSYIKNVSFEMDGYDNETIKKHLVDKMDIHMDLFETQIKKTLLSFHNDRLDNECKTKKE